MDFASWLCCINETNLSNGDILDVLIMFCEKQEIQVTITESVKGGLWAGGGAVVLGLFAGPAGLAVGDYTTCSCFN